MGNVDAILFHLAHQHRIAGLFLRIDYKFAPDLALEDIGAGLLQRCETSRNLAEFGRLYEIVL
jgi:hypothetical protein